MPFYRLYVVCDGGEGCMYTHRHTKRKTTSKILGVKDNWWLRYYIDRESLLNLSFLFFSIFHWFPLHPMGFSFFTHDVVFIRIHNLCASPGQIIKLIIFFFPFEKTTTTKSAEFLFQSEERKKKTKFWKTPRGSKCLKIEKFNLIEKVSRVLGDSLRFTV